MRFKQKLQKICVGILSVLLVLAIFFPGMPVYAATEEINMSTVGGDVTITPSGYTIGAGAPVAHTDGYVLKGSTSAYTVTFEAGTYQVTLDNVTINASASGMSAIALKPEAEVVMTLKGMNSLSGGTDPVSPRRLRGDLCRHL